MNKKIRSMSMEKIVKLIGLPRKKRTFLDALADPRNIKAYNEVFDMLEEEDGVLRLIKDDKRFDKDKFVYLIGLEMQEIVDNSTLVKNDVTQNLIVKPYKEAIKKIKDLIKDEEVIVTDTVIEKDKIDVIISSSLDFNGRTDVRKARKQEKINRLNKIKQEKPEIFEEMIKNINPIDFMDLISTNRDIGFRMISLIYGNTLIKQGKITGDNISDDSKMYAELSKKLEREEYRDELEKALYKYVEFFDIDKVILTTMTRKYMTQSTSDRNIEKMNEIKSYINGVMGYIENPRVSISGDTEGIVSEKNKLVKMSAITLKDIRYSMENYMNGIDYSRKDVVNNMIIGLASGDVNIDELSDEELLLLAKRGKRKNLLSTGDKCVLRFLTMNELTPEEIKNIKKGNLSNELFINLYMEGKLKKDEILGKYINEEIKLDGITELKSKLENKNELDEIVNSKDLVKYFLHKEDGETQKEEYQRYKRLFTELKIRKVANDERIEIGNDVISQDDQLLEEKHLTNLYRDNLITIDNAIDWGGEDIAISMLKKGELSAKDARRLFDKGIIKIGMFEEIAKDQSLKVVKRLVIINSTFSDIEDEEIRHGLLEKISFEKKESTGKRKRNIKGPTGKIKNVETDKKTARNETDPSMRWNLFKMIDPDYMEDITRDGCLVKRMLNEGLVVIEPLYQSDDNISKYSYGVATRIVEKDVFEENESNIITENNKVDIGFLNELESAGEGVYKIIHTAGGKKGTNTWAKRVVRLILDRSEIERTYEEIGKINEAAELVDRSNRRIEIGI